MTTREDDQELAKVQLAAGDQDARIDEDERAETDEDGAITVALRDQEFRLSDEVAIMALMEWAAAGDNTDSSTANLAAVFHVLQSLVHEDDWNAFRAYARTAKVDLKELIDFQNAAFEALSGNPTEPAETSASSSSRTSGGSTARRSGTRGKGSKR